MPIIVRITGIRIMVIIHFHLGLFLALFLKRLHSRGSCKSILLFSFNQSSSFMICRKYWIYYVLLSRQCTIIPVFVPQEHFEVPDNPLKKISICFCNFAHSFFMSFFGNMTTDFPICTFSMLGDDETNCCVIDSILSLFDLKYYWSVV